MWGKFEVIAYWKGRRTARYFERKLETGIADTIRLEMEARGFRLVEVKAM